MVDKLITVARAGYIHRAYYFKELLGNAGIESIILNQGMTGAQAENEIELQVEEEDVPKALEIVDDAYSNYESREIEQISQSISIRNILVPVDFSSYSLNASKYALYVAKQKNASIMFVHSYYDAVPKLNNYESFYSYPPDLNETQHELEHNAAELMETFMRKLNKFMELEGISGIRAKRRIMAGSAEEVVLSMIENDQYDLVIVGSLAIVPSDSWFGTFSSTLIEKTTVPVLAIPEEAVYNKSSFKRLMYATNFDKSDGIAIRRLLEIAAPLETQIHVIHIDATNDNAFINFNLTHFKEKYVGKIENVKLISHLIVSEDVIKAMEDYINKEKIDILAVTTHKRNVITSFLDPSITKELLYRIPIPLLVFHPNP